MWCAGNVPRYKSKYKKVGVLLIRIVKSNVSSESPSSEMMITFFLWQRANARLVRLYYIHIGSTPTFLYFDLNINDVPKYISLIYWRLSIIRWRVRMTRQGMFCNILCRWIIADRNRVPWEKLTAYSRITKPNTSMR